MEKIRVIFGPRLATRVVCPGAKLVSRGLQKRVSELDSDENESYTGEAQPGTSAPKQTQKQQRIDQQAESKRRHLRPEWPPAMIKPQNMICVMQQSEKDRRDDK